MNKAEQEKTPTQALGMPDEELEVPTIEEMKKTILNYPEKIRRKEQRIITCTGQLAETDKEIKEKELAISEIIINDVDDKGKKRYGNQTARDIELQRRLSFIDGFGQLKAQKEYLVMEVNNLKCEAGYDRRMFEAYNSIARL